MVYIIDANNLAGKLNILDEENFDHKLIKMIKQWNYDRNRNIILVFDGIDFMGDKYSEGNLTVIYTPKDNYYKSADDKIIELASAMKANFVVITDDLGIIEEIKKIRDKIGRDIMIQKATQFALKLARFLDRHNDNKKIDNKGGLSNNNIKEINEELLKKWK